MNKNISSYYRLMHSTKAEQILAKAKIFIDTNSLRPHLIGKDVNKNSELYKFMKNASQNSGYISTEYDSKHIITARMFTKKNHLNLIGLHDKNILSSVRSRYDGGLIAVFDYNNFEPSIIRHCVGDAMPEDLHGWASTTLNIDRNVIKVFNMTLMYGKDFSFHASQICKDLITIYECDEEQILHYIDLMIKLKDDILEYIKPLQEQYKSEGFVMNTYGRKIFPKKESNIFSNVIQSIGSEIMIDSIIKVNKEIVDRNIHLLFHRFDALYFDMSRNSAQRGLSDIKNAMETISDSLHIDIGIQVGVNLLSLKELDSG